MAITETSQDHPPALGPGITTLQDSTNLGPKVGAAKAHRSPSSEAPASVRICVRAQMARPSEPTSTFFLCAVDEKENQKQRNCSRETGGIKGLPGCFFGLGLFNAFAPGKWMSRCMYSPCEGLSQDGGLRDCWKIWGTGVRHLRTGGLWPEDNMRWEWSA